MNAYSPNLRNSLTFLFNLLSEMQRAWSWPRAWTWSRRFLKNQTARRAHPNHTVPARTDRTRRFLNAAPPTTSLPLPTFCIPNTRGSFFRPSTLHCTIRLAKPWSVLTGPRSSITKTSLKKATSRRNQRLQLHLRALLIRWTHFFKKLCNDLTTRKKSSCRFHLSKLNLNSTLTCRETRTEIQTFSVGWRTMQDRSVTSLTTQGKKYPYW